MPKVQTEKMESLIRIHKLSSAIWALPEMLDMSFTEISRALIEVLERIMAYAHREEFE